MRCAAIGDTDTRHSRTHISGTAMRFRSGRGFHDLRQRIRHRAGATMALFATRISRSSSTGFRMLILNAFFAACRSRCAISG